MTYRCLVESLALEVKSKSSQKFGTRNKPKKKKKYGSVSIGCEILTTRHHRGGKSKIILMGMMCMGWRNDGKFCNKFSETVADEHPHEEKGKGKLVY